MKGRDRYSRRNMDFRSVLLCHDSRIMASKPAALITFAVSTIAKKATPKPISKPRRLENPRLAYIQCRNLECSTNCGSPRTEKNGAMDAIPMTVENAMLMDNSCAPTTQRL